MVYSALQGGYLGHIAVSRIQTVPESVRDRVDCNSRLPWSDVCFAESLPVFSVDSLRNPVALGHRHGKPKPTENQARGIAEQFHAGDAKWRT